MTLSLTIFSSRLHYIQNEKKKSTNFLFKIVFLASPPPPPQEIRAYLRAMGNSQTPTSRAAAERAMSARQNRASQRRAPTAP